MLTARGGGICALYDQAPGTVRSLDLGNARGAQAFTCGGRFGV